MHTCRYLIRVERRYVERRYVERRCALGHCEKHCGSAGDIRFLQVLFHAQGYIWKRSNERLVFSNYAIDSGTFVCYTKKAQKRANANVRLRIRRIFAGWAFPCCGCPAIDFGCIFLRLSVPVFAISRPLTGCAFFANCVFRLRSHISPIHGFPPGYGRRGRFFDMVCRHCPNRKRLCFFVPACIPTDKEGENECFSAS